MANRLSSRDLWHAFRADWWGSLKRAYFASEAANLSLIAAGTAFYAFSSIAPILAATVLTYGLIADAATVQANIRALFALLPNDAASLISQQLDMVASGSDGKKGAGLVVALLVALYGGSKAASSMMTALDVAYEVKDARNLIVATLTALGIVAGGVVLVLVGIGSSTVTAFLGSLIPWTPPIVRVAITLTSYALLGAIVVTGASLLFRFGPYRPRSRLRWATPGALLATIVWVAATAGFGLYVSNFGNYGATYGSLSAIIVSLTWLWLSAYAFLLGASLDVQLYRARAPKVPVEIALPAAQDVASKPGVVASAGLTLLGLGLLIVRRGHNDR